MSMNPQTIQILKQQLTVLEVKMLAECDKRKQILDAIHPDQSSAARNLIHYLVLRNEDIRPLQDMLHISGLSSLASAESHIRRQIQSIRERLGHGYDEHQLETCDYTFSLNEIAKKSEMLFGSKPDPIQPNIMVTFDTSFAEDYSIIKGLLQNGMNVARINCAHDDEVTWSRMIQHLKRACRHTGVSCKIYMDLAGPKFRTILTKKGKRKGHVKTKEGQIVWLAEDTKGFSGDDIVINPNEKGIIEALKKGDRIYIDDGVIKGHVEKINKNGVAVRIIRIAGKNQIKQNKGINFPDTYINTPSLTDFDLQCLPFVCHHADLLGYSFVRKASDLEALIYKLKEFAPVAPEIVLKIETPQAVENLPGLLLCGMTQKVFGVMIARGDLAVEIGFERMGEIQEEILWICEAAHVPVIWATQVLENLNKAGIATRSEITDASYAAMAECVMINKGDHTLEVLETLRSILHRTAGHHAKKRFMFRPLNIAKRFIDAN